MHLPSDILGMALGNGQNDAKSFGPEKISHALYLNDMWGTRYAMHYVHRTWNTLCIVCLGAPSTLCSVGSEQ